MRPLTPDHRLECRFHEIGRHVSSGGIERTIGERFMVSQQRADVRDRHGRNEFLRGAEGIDGFRELIERVAMPTLSPFA